MLRYLLVFFSAGAVLLPGQIRGAALWSSSELVSWGDGVVMHDVRTGQERTLVPGDFGEGGCAAALDSGRGVVVQQGQGLGKLVWLKEPDWKPETIDSEVETHDCLGAELHGRRGVLVVHRFGQVRFYEPPTEPGHSWPYTEIYSFYTSSHQGGLLQMDADGDGRPDLVCGDYWIRNPESFELGWRLFALHLWFEEPESALVRIAPAGRAVVEAQAHTSPARLAWFEPRRDVRQQWIQRRIGEDLQLRRLHGLDTADVDGDGSLDIVTAEDAGPGSRLLVFLHRGDSFEPRIAARTNGVVFLKIIDGGQEVVTAGADGVRRHRIGNK